MKKTLIALAVLGLAYVAAAWTTGRIVQHQLDRELARVLTLLPTLKVTEDTHTRGVFGSTRLTTLDMSALLGRAECTSTPDADAPPPGMTAPAAEPLRLSIKQTITHGPFPGFGLPAAARVSYDLLVNGQSPDVPQGVQPEGEMPVLTVRYGFGGDARLLLKGDAGSLTMTGKDGHGSVSLSWPSLRFSGHSSADGSAIAYQGTLPELTVALTAAAGEASTLRLKGLSVQADHRYPIPGQLFVTTGDDSLALTSFTATSQGKEVLVAEGLEGKSQSHIDAGLMESSTQITLASAKAEDTLLGPLHYDYTLARLDAAAYGQLMQTLISNDSGRCATEKSAALVQQFESQLPALLKSGPEFRIDRLSIGYQGQQAQLTGKLSLPAAIAEPLTEGSAPMALLATANASLTLALPDVLIQKLAVKSVASKMAQEMALSNGAETLAPLTAEQTAEAESQAQRLVADQITQALAKNWIVRGKDGISAHLEYRDGSVLLNGQPLDYSLSPKGLLDAPPPQ